MIFYSEFYFWQSIMRAIKQKGRRGLTGEGVVGYIRLDVHKATNNKPNALRMNFPLQASRSSHFLNHSMSKSRTPDHMDHMVLYLFLNRLKKVRNSPHDGKIW